MGEGESGTGRAMDVSLLLSPSGTERLRRHGNGRLRGAPVGDLEDACLESIVYIGLHGITSGDACVYWLASRRLLCASNSEPDLERYGASCFLAVMTRGACPRAANIRERVVRLFARLPTRRSSAVLAHFLRV